MCRQGSSVIQTHVLETLDEPGLSVYIAWVPILPDDGRPDGGNLALVSDARARHFWDRHGVLSPLFRPVLGLPAEWPAWDVYLAYPPGATWTDVPPAPAFWHHQLGDSVDAPVLDGPRFASQLRELIAEVS